MTDSSFQAAPAPKVKDAREWVKALSAYREPDTWRSLFEIAVTLGPFIALWALAWWSLGISYWLTFAISVVNAAFLLRLFIIQHDCGHGSFFKSKLAADWLGRMLGVLTLTPYDVWRRAHAIHHGSAGNLGKRELGEIYTLTVDEYLARSPFNRFLYRLYRNPIVLFILGPGYIFLLEYRLPIGLTAQVRYWLSAMATNAGILAMLTIVYLTGGLMPILLIFLPTTLLAATAGVWLFYVQHQFETTHWAQQEDWQLHEAALKGSSYYVLPPVLQWLTGNIGIHHVHHLYSRIPYYRLPEVLRDHTSLAKINRMTIRESIATAKLHLWDERTSRLLSFSEVHASR